jgi:hypothetical protein
MSVVKEDSDHGMTLGKRPDSAQRPLLVSAVEAVAHAMAHHRFRL